MNINERTRLKAVLMASKTHYMQKVITHRTELKDGLEPKFRSFIDVFIPKLTLKHQKPTCMFYVANGNGRCLIRLASPFELAEQLEKIVMILRCNLWADIWLQLDGLSNDLIIGLYDDPNTRPLIDDKRFVEI
jgi:hypothetical protein